MTIRKKIMKTYQVLFHSLVCLCDQILLSRIRIRTLHICISLYFIILIKIAQFDVLSFEFSQRHILFLIYYYITSDILHRNWLLFTLYIPEYAFKF